MRSQPKKDNSPLTMQTFFNKTIFNLFFMKQKLFGAAAMVAFILAGVSCSKQEQSEFNFDSIEQEVTISATVTYSTGVDINSTSYSIINSKPAAGRKVFIEVPYGQYKNGAEGNKIFETVTDVNGKFQITIPTKSTGVNATIRMEEFTDFYRTYEKMGADGKPVFKSELRNYSISVNAAGLKPGAYKFPQEIVYNSQKIDVDQFSESVTMTGKVNLAIETGFRKGTFKAADKANVEFEISYDNGALEYKFGTTTDAQGNYSITIPMKSLADGFTITGLKVLGIGNSSFIHFTNENDTTVIYGAYELYNFGNLGVAGKDFQNIIDGVTYNLGTQNLLFTPFFNDGITDTSDPDNWDDSLIGWAAGMPGFDESFSKTATLKGRIYMPKLTAFGEAAYYNEAQTIVLTGTVAPYDNGFTVITDASGRFSVDIPVDDDAAKTFNVTLDEEVQPFTFFDSKNKQIVLRDGAYDNNTNVKKEGAEWYELGDFYFHYTPTMANTPAEWEDNLIGWYKSDEFTQPVQVKGSILFAVEDSYGTGEYVAKPCIATIFDATNGRFFAVKTKSNGAYDFMLPLKDENDQPAIFIISDEYDVNDYVHYPEYGSDDTKLLSGTYSIYKTVYDNKNDKEAWNNLGTQYMYIDEGDLDHPTSTYNDNLAGWFIKADNDVVYKNTATASGKALKAEETGFLKGEYKAAKGMLVTLTVYGEDIAVLANNSGTFSFSVPLKNAGDKTDIDVSATGTDVENFKHYKYDGSIQILDGEYTGDPVKEDDTEWNELGNVYYKFTPKTPANAELWSTYARYIAGWAYKKGYKLTQTVSGKVMLAVEGSEEPDPAPESLFRVGHYTSVANIPVKIEVNGITYVAPTKADGTFAIDVVMQFADDTYFADWKNLTFDPKDLGMNFEHYRNPGSNAKMNVDGVYKQKATKNESTAKWYEKGTRYYEFDPDVDPKNWSDRLYGWDVWDLDQTKVLSVTGAVKLGDEDWFGADAEANIKWNVAPYALATVTVDGHVYDVATDEYGKFTVKIHVKEAPEKVKLTIDPDDITTSQFKHYPDHTKNSSKYISGTYESEGNIYKTEIQRSSPTSTSYDLTKNPLGAPFSAKMTLSYSGGKPDDWDHYDWSSYLSMEKNKNE